MTKKVKLADLTFKISDDGSLKVVGNEAQKTSKKLDRTSKSTRDVNRNMQAMSGRVESGTKGFARMQQGTGGLVQSYAILASTLFALGAAFRALENAANIENQIKGFRALAQITGTSLLSITASVRQATGGLLAFQDAAQQTAIASAAGFTATQITELANGAKLASVTLGRDLTDSFNRLIRGVTKAEPELLDELGIILRLDIATRKFASANGLVAEKLTIAERRMAVFEEVQRQLVSNFGAMEDKADEFLNPFTKLGTAINDLVISFQGPLVESLAGFASFLANNIGALTTAFTLLGLSILRQIMPAAGQLGEVFKGMGVKATTAATQSSRDMKALELRIKRKNRTTIREEIKASEVVKKEMRRRFGSEKVFLKKSILEQRIRIKQMIILEKLGLSKTGQFNQQRYNSLKVVEQRIREEIKKTGIGFKVHLQKIGLQIKRGITLPANMARQALASLAPTMRMVGQAAAFMTSIFSGLLNIFMAFFTIKFFVDMIPSIKKINDITEKLGEKLKATNIELKEMSFFADRTLLEDKLEKIRTEFGGIEGALKGANVELEFFNNMMKGISGPTSDTFEEFIREEASKIIELFAEGGTTGLGSQVQGLLFSTTGPGSPPPTLNESFAQRSSQTFGTTASQALEDATAIQLNSIITNAIAQINSGQIDVATDILSILGEDTAGKFVTGFQKAVEDEGELGQAAVAFTSAFKTELIKERVDEIAMTFFKGLDEGFTITGFSDALIEVIRLAMEGREAVQDITGVIVGFKQEATALGETLIQAFPKPSTTEKVAAQIDTLLGTAFERNKVTGEILNIEKEITLEFENGKKVTGSIAQIAEDILGIENKTNQEVFEILTTELARLDAADKRLQTTKIVQTLLKAEMSRLDFFNTRTNKRAKVEFQIAEIRRQQQENLDKQSLTTFDLVELQGRAKENLSDAEENVLATNSALETQIDLLEMGVDRATMLGKNLLETFDKTGATELAKLLETGDLSEFGGKELALGLATQLRKTVAKSAAEGMTDFVTGKIQGLFNIGGDKQLTPAEQMLEAHKEHVKSLEVVLQNHAMAFNNTMASSGGATSGGGASSSSGIDETGIREKAKVEAQAETDEIENLVTSDVSNDPTGFSAIFGDMGGIFDVFLGDLKGIFKGDGTTLFGEDGLFANLKAGIFGDGTEGGKGIFGNFMENLTGEGGGFFKAITNMFGGGGLGAMFGGTSGAGIGGMLGGLFGSGGGITGLLKPLLGMIPGIGPLLSILPFEKGGVIGLAKGGMMPRYASGGVATQPTYLVGEGKKHEAVVPLPDNRSIPVKMNGSGATNNTNISVNIDGNGNASADVTSDGAAQLGEAINMSVMETLIKEQRPGGLLNP